MPALFIKIGIFDILDIVLFAFLLYQIYLLIKGTIAISIFVGIFVVYIFYQVVSAFKMDLLSTIIGQFMSVGMITLVVVFQQEIRRFLLMLGNREFFDKRFTFGSLLGRPGGSERVEMVDAVAAACASMSASRTGALIVVASQAPLKNIVQTGDVVNADVSVRLIENIFFKNSPLHDGAMVIRDNRIVAARCILPLTQSAAVPASMGMRHRAAIGLTEATNALVVVVSEETGNISVFKPGQEFVNIDTETLKKLVVGYLDLGA